jgi:hypothetical protein
MSALAPLMNLVESFTSPGRGDCLGQDLDVPVGRKIFNGVGWIVAEGLVRVPDFDGVSGA